MIQIKHYILISLVAFIVACSPSEKVKSTAKSQKSHNKDLVDLPEKEQIKFKFLFHNANKERMLGNYQLAANLFKQCTEIAPKESASYYELAHTLENSKEPDLALEFAEKAIKLDPENYWYRVLYAHTLQRKGKSDEAIKQYKTLLKTNPENIDLYFDLAGIQLYSGKYKESIETFNQIEKQMGISEEISVQKEKIYIKLGDIDKAANEIQMLINKYPDELKYQVLLADLYLANDLTEKGPELTD